MDRPALRLGRRGGLQGRRAQTGRDLGLLQDHQHPVLTLQFELLQALPFDFLLTRHKPEIIIRRQLVLILLMCLDQATKLRIVSLHLLDDRCINAV